MGACSPPPPSSSLLSLQLPPLAARFTAPALFSGVGLPIAAAASPVPPPTVETPCFIKKNGRMNVE
jgi:hypothetical protein